MPQPPLSRHQHHYQHHHHHHHHRHQQQQPHHQQNNVHYSSSNKNNNKHPSHYHPSHSSATAAASQPTQHRHQPSHQQRERTTAAPLMKPLAALTTPGMYLLSKYSQYKRQQAETSKRKVTEKELVHLNHKIDKLLARLDDNDAELTESLDEECVVCLAAKASMQTFPCGHRVVCRKCFVKTIQMAVSQRCLPLRCVVCRTRILRLKQELSPSNTPSQGSPLLGRSPAAIKNKDILCQRESKTPSIGRRARVSPLAGGLTPRVMSAGVSVEGFYLANAQGKTDHNGNSREGRPHRSHYLTSPLVGAAAVNNNNNNIASPTSTARAHLSASGSTSGKTLCQNNNPCSGVASSGRDSVRPSSETSLSQSQPSSSSSSSSASSSGKRTARDVSKLSASRPCLNLSARPWKPGRP